MAGRRKQGRLSAATILGEKTSSLAFTVRIKGGDDDDHVLVSDTSGLAEWHPLSLEYVQAVHSFVDEASSTDGSRIVRIILREPQSEEAKNLVLLSSLHGQPPQHQAVISGLITNLVQSRLAPPVCPDGPAVWDDQLQRWVCPVRRT